MMKLNNMPLVSVVIPCYNSESYIDDCIASVLNQNYLCIEVIVVDDGSTDNSADKISKYTNVILLRQNNSGACVARNKGIKASKGKYIKFLDSDDVLELGAIKNQVELAENLDENFIVYGDCYVLKNGNKEYKNTCLSKNNQTQKIIMNDLLVSTPLHRKSMLESIGGFDESFKHGQEWNLHVRLSSFGYIFHHHKQVIFCYRVYQSPDRITSNKNISDDRVEHNIYKLKKTMLDLGPYASGNVLSAFALSFWWIGRYFYRKGNLEECNYWLGFAKSLTPHYKLFWPIYYKLAYNVLGFKASECVFKAAYSFKKNKYD